jgi:diaminopimelate decarboxylase
VELRIRPHIELDPVRGLLIGGVTAVKLAEKHGTPLYVYSEDAIRDLMREYTSALSGVYPQHAIVYAGKAYLTMRMAEIVHQEGLWLDVSSGGELFIALRAGFPPGRIVFHGNNKSIDEIAMAVSSGVGRIAIDNVTELERVQREAASKGVVQGVFLRLTPGIDPETHEYLATGVIDSKFGIPMHSGEHLTAVGMTLDSPNLALKGIHCHIGSQIFDDSPFHLAANIMVDFAAEVRDKLGYVIPELDLGGGLGVRYREAGEDSGIRRHLRNTAQRVAERCLRNGLPTPKLFFEPGRSLVAAAAVTLYTVGTVKTLPNGCLIAAVDGGMSDNPRPVLYGAEYEAIPARPYGDRELYDFRVVGKHCEEGDTLIRSAKLPMLSPGDVIAVPVSGAYQYAMRSNYNHLPHPAVVHVADRQSFVVVERQTLADLIAKERPVPPSLRNAGREGLPDVGAV